MRFSIVELDVFVKYTGVSKLFWFSFDSVHCISRALGGIFVEFVTLIFVVFVLFEAAAFVIFAVSLWTRSIKPYNIH